MELQLTKEQQETKKWYVESGYGPLLNLIDEIESKEEIYDSELNELITHHKNKKPREMNAEEQSEWYRNALRDFVRVNQLMLFVNEEMRKIRLGDDK